MHAGSQAGANSPTCGRIIIYPACQQQSPLRRAGLQSALMHRPSWLTRVASNRSRPSGQMAATVLPQSGSRHIRPRPCR